MENLPNPPNPPIGRRPTKPGPPNPLLNPPPPKRLLNPPLKNCGAAAVTARKRAKLISTCNASKKTRINQWYMIKIHFLLVAIKSKLLPCSF